MKNLIVFVLIFVFFTNITNAQGVGIGTLTPDPSAMLDVSATGQGFLPPRMTTVQRNAISNPAVGLLIFNTDTEQTECFTSSEGWRGCSKTEWGELPPNSVNLSGTGSRITGRIAKYSLVAGEVVVLDSNGEWNLTKLSEIAVPVGKPDRLLGVVANHTVGGTLATVYINSSTYRNDLWNWTPGQPLYLTDSYGVMSQVKPTDPNEPYVRIGYALSPTEIVILIAFDGFTS